MLGDPGYSSSNLVGLNPNIVSQYCNGSRVPPTCTVADGCGGPSGYGVPPGIADATSPNPVFSLTPAATVDEGNNWINVSWGPLSLSDDSVLGTDGNYGGGALFANYALTSGSPAVDYVPVTQTHPTADFFGNPRPDPGNPNRFDVGAIEFQGAGSGAVIVSPTSLTFSAVEGATTATQTLTLTNTRPTAAFTGLTVTVSAHFSRPGGMPGGTCGATLAANSSCTINIEFTAPATAGTFTGTAAITGSVAVDGSPVALTGTSVAPIRTASVSPSPLAFGNWASGTTSNPLNLTVTNTGNVALAGGSYTLGAVTPASGATFTRITTGAFPAGAPNCGATLTLGASCTIKVAFSAGTGAATNFTGGLTVAYTGATVTPTPVALTGSRVTARGAVTASFTPNPWTVATGVLTSSATVTLTNSATSASSVAVTGDTATGAGIIITGPGAGLWAFGKGADNCTGVNLAPGASCTLVVDVVRVGAIGTHNATVTFTDTATGSPQTIIVPATFQ